MYLKELWFLPNKWEIKIKFLRRFEIFDFCHADFNLLLQKLVSNWICYERGVLSSHNKNLFTINIFKIFFETPFIPHIFDSGCETHISLKSRYLISESSNTKEKLQIVLSTLCFTWEKNILDLHVLKKLGYSYSSFYQ